MSEPKRTIVIDTYFQQYRAAAIWLTREHERLIAEGWQWDGMDGYSK